MTGARFAAWVVAAQVLTQIGAFTLPALLPGYIEAWSLSATEAGWLVGAFFGAYVLAVPVLVTLTDLLPARRIYLVGTLCTAASHLGFALLADGFWSGLALRALAGIGWAGAYMPGLRAIADRLEGNAQSRAVSWHAAGVGIAGASSFAMAGLLESLAGPQAAFLAGGACALAATAIGWAVMPGVPPRRLASPSQLLDFRPVLRNRAAMAWIAGYTVHTWELHALRAWAIVFLAAVLEQPGTPGWLPGPTAIFTAIALLGIVVSVTGNETAQKHGRARVVALAMGAGAALSLLTGLSALLPPWLALLAVLAVVGWNSAIYLDSSALTAGTVQAADPARRGATMGLHSMCGYAGGFVGPLGVGLALDLAGGAPWAWALAFGHLAPVGLVGWWLVARLGRPASG